MDEKIDVSVIFPCRNEEGTVGICIDEAIGFFKSRGLSGEVIVVDNGSDDGSGVRAREHGARVIEETPAGYGRALRAGIRESIGDILLMCDCDTTYDISDFGKLYDMLRSGEYDMVIGDRFAGGIEPGAMPVSHIVGVQVLSAMGRSRFHADVNDFHCGIRGMTAEAARKLVLRTDGMEFATEMIAQAARAGMKTGQVPVRLKKSTLPRKSKLRTIRDGFRHLGYIYGVTQRRQ